MYVIKYLKQFDYKHLFCPGLLAPSHMEYDILRNRTLEPSVAELTAKAIKILKKNPKGFFLMVEGESYDSLFVYRSIY